MSNTLYTKDSTWGRITIISEIFRGKFKQYRVRVRCECGKGYEVDIRSIRNGQARMCRSCAGKLGAAKTHGFRSGGKREELYVKWIGMRGRCNNEKNKDYKNFGGRGINVCPEWADYKIFRSWAIKAGYKPGYILYRKSLNKDYCPKNCFLSKLNQFKNKYKFRNKEYLISELHKVVGSNVPLSTVKNRLSKKWGLLEALLRPMGLKIRRSKCMMKKSAKQKKTSNVASVMK